MSAPDVIGFYDALGVDLRSNGNGWAPIRCLTAREAHTNGDRNPSAGVNLDSGVHNCQVHGATSPFDVALAFGRSRREAMELLLRYGLRDDDGRRHPPEPISTERTERSPKTPVDTGDKRSVGGANGHRTHTERSKPPGLASESRILDHFDEKMTELGLIGERHIARATYLVHVSRLLSEPARANVKGDSSTGKSYAVECGLRPAAPEFMWARSSTSPLAMFYSEESFEHRTLVFYEKQARG